MKRVIIAPHMRCNAQCMHCCVSSSPHDNRQLADDDVFRLVDEAINDSSVDMVSFTGGEALLRRNFILRLIRRISEAGKATTLVSNGFWGVTPDIATVRLTELRDAGLHVLTLSADVFHNPYVHPDRIKFILDAHHSVPGIRIHLNMCESKSNNADAVLDVLGDSAKNISITRFPISPVGSAEQISDSEITYSGMSTDQLCCPGQMILFASDDRVYPCCSTGVMNSSLSIGRASALSINEAARRIEQNLLFRLMTHEGLNWIVERYKLLGIEKYQQPFPIVDACHLCCELFADPENIKRLRPALEEYRRHYFNSHSHHIMSAAND